MTDKGIKRDRRTNRNRQIRLIYIGIPSRKKENLSMFIHALMASTSCERYEFDLYGLTENDYQRIFKDKIDLKRWANIHFWGKVSQEEISNALRNSDYSVIFREDNRINRAGFPTKMGTSLSNDVPVLATPVGDIPKYIRNGLNGYLLPLDNNSLVAFLEQLPDLDEPEVDCDSLYWARYVGNLKCYEQLFN